MEIWDIIDADRNWLGTCARGTELPRGQYHLIVDIWVQNAEGKLLVTKRAEEKSYAHLWENTAGSVLAGEDSESAAVRELAEETGIRIAKEDLVLLEHRRERRTLWDSWFVRTSAPPESVVLQEGETEDFRWVTVEELDRMVAIGELASPVTYRYHRVKDVLMERMAGD